MGWLVEEDGDRSMNGLGEANLRQLFLSEACDLVTWSVWVLEETPRHTHLSKDRKYKFGGYKSQNPPLA